MFLFLKLYRFKFDNYIGLPLTDFVIFRCRKKKIFIIAGKPKFSVPIGKIKFAANLINRNYTMIHYIMIIPWWNRLYPNNYQDVLAVWTARQAYCKLQTMNSGKWRIISSVSHNMVSMHIHTPIYNTRPMKWRDQTKFGSDARNDLQAPPRLTQT